MYKGPWEPVEKLTEAWDAEEGGCRNTYKDKRSLEQNKRLWECIKFTEKGKFNTEGT